MISAPDHGPLRVAILEWPMYSKVAARSDGGYCRKWDSAKETTQDEHHYVHLQRHCVQDLYLGSSNVIAIRLHSCYAEGVL